MSMIKLDMHKSQHITDSSLYTMILFALKCRNLRYPMGYLIKINIVIIIVISSISISSGGGDGGGGGVSSIKLM